MRRIPAPEVLTTINDLTSKDFDFNEVFEMLQKSCRLLFAGGRMELDSILIPDAIHLFVDGVCFNTIYMLTSEGVIDALSEGITILLENEQNSGDVKSNKGLQL